MILWVSKIASENRGNHCLKGVGAIDDVRFFIMVWMLFRRPNRSRCVGFSKILARKFKGKNRLRPIEVLISNIKYCVLDLGLYASASRKQEGYPLEINKRLSNDS
jgi:hypothetical protein